MLALVLTVEAKIPVLSSNHRQFPNNAWMLLFKVKSGFVKNSKRVHASSLTKLILEDFMGLQNLFFQQFFRSSSCV